MSATVCNNAIVREQAHVLARDAKTHAKPIRKLHLAGYITAASQCRRMPSGLGWRSMWR